MSRRAVFSAALFALFAQPALGQSSLGIAGVELTLGGYREADGGTSVSGELLTDVAVTNHHGLQGELAWHALPAGGVGRIGGHLYMVPRETRKYGLFAVVGDVDGRSFLYGHGGVEGMVSLSPRATLGAHAGLGFASEGLDYIFGGVDARFRMSDALQLEAGAGLSEFDEVGFQAMGAILDLSMRYAPTGTPVSVSVGVEQDLLLGVDGAPGETRAMLRLSWRFGETNAASPLSRPFRTPDPILQLVRRGIY